MNRRTLLQSIIGAAIAPEIPMAEIKPLRIIGTGTPYDPAKYHGEFKWVNMVDSPRWNWNGKEWVKPTPESPSPSLPTEP
jgi:hypothetical protein